LSVREMQWLSQCSGGNLHKENLDLADVREEGNYSSHGRMKRE